MYVFTQTYTYSFAYTCCRRRPSPCEWLGKDSTAWWLRRFPMALQLWHGSSQLEYWTCPQESGKTSSRHDTNPLQPQAVQDIVFCGMPWLLRVSNCLGPQPQYSSEGSTDIRFLKFSMIWLSDGSYEGSETLGFTRSLDCG